MSTPPEPTTDIYTPHQRHVLLIASILILSGLILFGLLHYLTAFLGAGILYVVLRPWYTALVHRRRWNRRLVTALLLLLTLVVLIIPFFALTTLLFDRLREFVQHTDQILKVVHRIEEITGAKIATQQNVQNLVQQGATRVSRWLPTLAGDLLQLIVIIGMMLFTMYYLFVEEEAFLRGLRRYLPFRAETREELAESLKNNVNANVLGQVLISLVQAILTGLALWIFGVPDPLFWGLVSFFMAFIPVLGTPLVWGPAAIYQFAQGETGMGIGILLAGGIVIMNIDNLLRIVLAKQLGDIHPLVTLAGVVLGVELFGILGLVIGPLLLSYLIVLMKVFRRENRRQAEV